MMDCGLVRSKPRSKGRALSAVIEVRANKREMSCIEESMTKEKIEFLSAVLIVSSDPKRLATFYRDVVGIPLEAEEHDDTLPHTEAPWEIFILPFTQLKISLMVGQE